jgi:KipI family sensor histidine kinase inhibitor
MVDWEWLGDRAIRFTRPAVSARALVRAVRAWPGCIDVVVAQHGVAAYFDREPVIDSAQIAALARLDEVAEPPREHELHAIYDGPDLAALAQATGIDVAAVHAARTYTVDAVGFAPGFAYLSGLDPRLETPRLATPRTRVPAGSIGIAGTQTAVYPFDSPGGWHLVGRVVGVKMFTAEGPLLQLGDRVRFVR